MKKNVIIVADDNVLVYPSFGIPDLQRQ